jgi:hypothetical protein
MMDCKRQDETGGDFEPRLTLRQRPAAVAEIKSRTAAGVGVAVSRTLGVAVE